MGGCTTNLLPLARLLLLGVAAAILWPRACRAKSLLHDVDAKRLLKANNTVGCPTPNGTVLLPGEDLMVVGDRGCTIMQCTEQGLDTLEAECWAPRCVQPQRKPRACCLSCPDGDSCRLPSGEVIRADTEYRDSRMICSCPLIKKGLGWDEDLVNAVCRLVTTTAPPPTTRPPTCALPDGDSLGVGLTRVVPDGKNGCRKYECDGRHHLTVSYGECRTLNCVNPVRRPGACCMTCPNDTDSSSGPESYVTSPAPERNVTSTLRVLYVDVITFLKLLFGFPVQLGHGNRTVGGQQGDHWNRHGTLGTQDKSNGTQGTQGTHRGNQRRNRGNRWGSHGNQLGSHGNQRGSRGNRLGSHGNRRGSHGNRRGNQSGIQENQRGSHKNRWGSQVGSRGNGSGSQSGTEESGKRKTWRWQWFSHGKKRGCTRKGNGQRGYRLPSESPSPDPKAASESLSAEPEVETESLPAPEQEVESVLPPAPEPEVEPVSLPSLESEMYSSLQLSQDSAGSQEVIEQQLLQQKRRQARRLRKQDRQQRKKERKQRRKGQMTQKQLEERRSRNEKRKKRQEERRRLQEERKKKRLEDRQQRKEERTRKQEERTRLQEERKKKQLQKRQRKKEERKRKQDERTRRQELRQRRRKQKKV